MGTRGLYSYRYRRRYHTTYNHMDSFLDGLGSTMVAKVPTDPAQFRAWVEKRKNELEAQYRGWKDELKHAQDVADGGSLVRAPECPFSMRGPTLDLFIEYTYVVDFDRNVFTVNESAHLPLDAIPRGRRGDECMTAVSDNAHPARILHLSPTLSPPEPRHLALYEKSGATQLLDRPTNGEAFAFPTCSAIMDYFFRLFRFVYSPVLDCIENYEPNHPDFIAMVHAILSLATWGQFCMHTAELTPSYDNKLITVEPHWSDLTNDDADTDFWHFSTLVILEVGLDDQERLRSAVGRAVELWRASSKAAKNPTAFIISLKTIVTVHLSDATVSHSAPIELLGAVTQSQPPFLPLSHSVGFAILKHHFTPALPAARPQDALPLDVLDRVFDMCDDATLSTLRLTCKTVRTLCLARPRFRVGAHRLLYHVRDNEFTALSDDSGPGATLPVVVGKFGRAVDAQPPGGFGFPLVLSLPAERGDHRVSMDLMGLRCIPKTQRGSDSMVLDEQPDVNWRAERMFQIV